MKPFRKSRDNDGQFALTTLQNPFLELRSRIEIAEDVARASSARAAVAAPSESAPAAPPPSRTPRENSNGHFLSHFRTPNPGKSCQN